MSIAPSIASQWRAARRRGWVLAILCGVALAMATVVWGSFYAHRYYLDEAATRGANTLRLSVAVLRGHMARYESLPRVIADFAAIRDLLTAPGGSTRIDEINAYLKQINAQFDSSDIYVIDADGTTIAASNYDSETTFIGENFRYRPYFSDAIVGGEGRFYALGTTSLKRGYYFGAPVMVEGEVAGVVAVKIEVDSIEDTWRDAGGYEIVVTDPEGIIFMTSRAQWLYHSILPLTPDRVERTVETRRYADASLTELSLTQTTESGHPLYSITYNGEPTEFLVVAEAMPEADWTVSVLLDTASARSQAITAIIIAGLAIIMTALALAIYLQRRARLSERLQIQREAKETLERRVIERTSELASLNRRLETEVAERRSTEIMLRKTQTDLIQAGKLAALGQMSAALSHEFNQPLSAARNYADNAQVLIERGRVEDAATTLSRISGLIDRMSAISRHLRNFARMPNQKLTAVPLKETIDDTLEIVNWRLVSGQIDLAIDLGDIPLFVTGGPVRLQQVLVNILSNAIDAVEETGDRHIAITAHEHRDKVVLSIRDHGPGITSGLNERIFDPFFSTKGVGKGLGLGLSISYNIIKDFGGELRAENHPEGGAVFTIELLAAKSSLNEPLAEAIS
ncbi:two-component sensor histidine kinase [Devosia pacifica]|uniref:C4-dicarboxylate transport sensor protein DctB n=1 Tax=Devosia pacifica TaxID=1335967 RepID=A0A918VW97_9HYPH|nr:sensor histidine kinase [Devosia pacifica]GHA35619.1 two-component sensor histidine kinase [Devosia pacifica]